MNRNYLKIETGEPYQPVRLTYQITDKSSCLAVLEHLNCIDFDEKINAWRWLRMNEISNLKLLAEINLNDTELSKVALGFLTLNDSKKLYIDFPSFERAYLAVPYFYRWLNPEIACLIHADLYNSFSEEENTILLSYNNFFNESELANQLKQRQVLFNKMVKQLESLSQQAMSFYLDKYASFINQQPLLKQERYLLCLDGINRELDKAKMVFFTGALMLRELVARKHWLGDKHYTLQQAALALEKLYPHAA